MAVEKEKVIIRYKALFGSVGLSQTRLDELSAKLGLKMADEATDEDIDARLNEMNDLYPFTEIKKNDDRATNDRNNSNRKPPVTPETEVKKEDSEEKTMMALLLEMKTELTSLKTEKLQDSLETRFRKDERMKGVPELIIKRSIPKTEEEYEETVTGLQTEFKEFAEKNKLAAFGKDAPPSGTQKKVGEVTVKTAEETKALADSI